MLKWERSRRDQFRRQVFEIITTTPGICVIAGVGDSALAYQLGNVHHPEDIYFGTYKVVTERFLYMLQDKTRSMKQHVSGIIVADHRNGQQDNRMRVQHERLVRETQRYTSQYKHFIEGVFLVPSHMNTGVQLADMVAGAVWRYHEHGDAKWLDVIKPAFRHNGNGVIDGFGVARFPKDGWKGPVVER